MLEQLLLRAVMFFALYLVFIFILTIAAVILWNIYTHIHKNKTPHSLGGDDARR